MALNLARTDIPLVVWNRTPDKTQPLREAGAQGASSIDQVFSRYGTVIVMLVDSATIDLVLGRGTPACAQRVAGHVVVSMSPVAPDFLRGLAADIEAAGGGYAASPVSGSRKPAEAGQLVALLGGGPNWWRRSHPCWGSCAAGPWRAGRSAKRCC